MTEAADRSAAAGSSRRNSRVWMTCVVSSVALLLAGCGSTVDEAELAAAGNGGGTAGAVVAAPGAASGVDPGIDTGAVGAVPAAGALTAPGTATAAVGTTATAAPGTATTAGTNTGAKGGGNAAAAPGTGGAAVATGANAPCAKTLSPIRLGQTMAVSGVVGAAIQGLRPGTATWVAAVNARGGIQCHPVELIQLDDGSDPSKVSANYNTLVKQRGVVAILAAGVPITFKALQASAERDKFPIVGGDLVSQDWYRSPYFFPQGGQPIVAYDGAYVLSKQGGAKKIGLIYCVEASICTELKANHDKAVARSGLAAGPTKAVSLTQPDFSAECKLMKDAGVDVIWIAVEGSSLTRLARSCVSLNYRPTIATSGIATNPQAVADKNLRSFGVHLGHEVAPFVSTEIPGVAEMRAALKQFAPNVSLDPAVTLGWASGKLLEAALAKVADKARAGDITTAMILEGLWQLKNEKLNGLTVGVTFAKDKVAVAPECYFGLKLDESGFTAPQGGKPLCFDKPAGGGVPQVAPGAATAAAGPGVHSDRRRRSL